MKLFSRHEPGPEGNPGTTARPSRLALAEDSPSEDRLVALGRKGDREAFNALVALYQNQVFSLCLRMLANSEAAADATQDCFLSAFSGIKRFKGGNFRSWILRIATNTCFDQLRSRRRRPTVSLDDLLLDPEQPFDVPDPGELPQDVALRKELAAAIQVGLLNLPPDQRAAVILSDIQGLSYEEIAEATGASLGTVKSRLNRGRTRLRDFMLVRRELLPKDYRLRV